MTKNEIRKGIKVKYVCAGGHTMEGTVLGFVGPHAVKVETFKQWTTQDFLTGTLQSNSGFVKANWAIKSLIPA